MVPLAASLLLGSLVLTAWQAHADDHEGAIDAIVTDGRKALLHEVESFCADQWPSDFVMRKHCRKEALKAYGHAQSFDIMKDNEHAVIWSTCSANWTDKLGRTDWFMMSHCLDEQISAQENP
ncbi:hypothetical protein RFM26_26330 [Mesorhizobium sp. VK23B]|uniref:Uncharacterized protein n=1 Tax=Mesorhizobium dulcispinae TaxID=3072316 RepID=A0ABU4XLN6_9HYPH|nr:MULTISPECIES: hypothetical protein [unclassified Mesorhizobium]MDX8469221.1 hypothetical protein [Mesorhizobium sp. VK23B]MDX8475646.1 hypothetical protein [Mesorhizobium sp. VK23A]